MGLSIVFSFPGDSGILIRENTPQKTWMVDVGDLHLGPYSEMLNNPMVCPES